jgi:hypothetical protein
MTSGEEGVHIGVSVASWTGSLTVKDSSTQPSLTVKDFSGRPSLAGKDGSAEAVWAKVEGKQTLERSPTRLYVTNLGSRRRPEPRLPSYGFFGPRGQMVFTHGQSDVICAGLPWMMHHVQVGSTDGSLSLENTV